MNKQNMWFLTLFSLILVLSVYYVTMPNELLLANNSSYKIEDTINEKEVDLEKEKIEVTIEESEELVALRASHEDKMQEEISKLEVAMTNEEATIEEKNQAYEQIQYLTTMQGKEESIETKIKNEYKLDSFVSIDNSVVNVVVAKKDHDVNLANNIMKTVQKEFENKMYITVKFAN